MTAAKNWSGLLKKLYLGQEHENKPSQSQRSSITKGNAFPMATAQRPVMRYMPTYRLDPKVPLNKEKCENTIKAVMNKTFAEFSYNPKNTLNLTAQVSEEIKNRIKSYNFDRYRYIVVVTIGERIMQGYYSFANFLWDAEKDGYISYVYDDPKFFALATLYYLYYD